VSLPVGLTSVTLTGTYTDASGAAQAGSVSITPTSSVTDAAGKTILTETAVTAILNSSGSFTLGPIPTTDNAGLTPQNWAYSISVSVPGAQQTFSPVYIPHALGSSVDVSALLPSPPTPVTGSPAPSGVLYLPNAATVPVDAPTLGGGFFYADAGNLYWFGSSGTRTKIASS